MATRTATSHDPYACFRYANYRAYTLGNFLSVLGQQMLRVAVSFDVYQQTHSKLALGLIGLFIWLPIFFFMLPGGMVADRFNRKAIVLICNLLYAFCALGLALVPQTASPIHFIYAILFFSGIARAFSDPARQSLLPQLVPREHFSNALTWNSSIFQTASVAGPALGGILYAAIGYANVCWLDFFLELVFFGFVLAVRQSPTNFKRESISLQSLITGLKFVWSRQLILATITMDLFAVILGGAVALLPAFATDILHCGSVGMGWLQAATPLGAFLMSFLMAHRPMKKAGLTLLWAVTGFGVATILFGISQWFWLSFLTMFLIGAFDNISVIVRSTLVQVLTPDAMRGRVTAVSYIFIHSSNELGGFESGLTAQLFGLVPAVVVGGIGSILVVLGVLVLWPQIAKLGSLDHPQSGSKPKRRK